MNIMSDVLDMSSGKFLYNGTDIKRNWVADIGKGSWFATKCKSYYPEFHSKKTIRAIWVS